MNITAALVFSCVHAITSLCDGLLNFGTGCGFAGSRGSSSCLQAAHERGATDYVLKDDLRRLGPAVHRALREAQLQLQRRQAEEELRSSESKLRMLSEHLLKVREEERKRIALEIHDELGQQLTGLKIAATLAEKAAFPPDGRSNTSSLREQLDRLARMTDDAIATVRRIATELRPAELDMFGLLDALKWQSQEFTKKTGIPCTFSSGRVNETFREEMATALFRIFQEALTNVARHANATHVQATLSVVDDTVELRIADNGKGIVARSIEGMKSLGLLGMAERARSLKGSVAISSEPPPGPTVTVTMPLHPEGVNNERT